MKKPSSEETAKPERNTQSELQPIREPAVETFEALDLVFWVCNTTLTQTFYVSPAYEKVWGRTCSSLYERPMSFIDAVHSGDRERVMAAVRQRINSGELAVEYRIIRPDGTVHWIWDRGFPLRNERGEPIRVIGVAQDITDRKRIEIELSKRQIQLAEAEALAHLGSWEWDITADTLIWSDELYRILGFRPGEFDPTHQVFLALVHPKDRPGVEQAIGQALNGERAYEPEIRILRRDGEQRVLCSRGVVIRNEAGRPVRMFGTAQDITVQKQAQEQILFQASLLEQVRNAVIATDLAGNILYWNRFAETLYQWKTIEVLGRNITDITVAEESRGTEILKASMTAGFWHGELLSKRKDGSTFHAEVADTLLQRWRLPE